MSLEQVLQRVEELEGVLELVLSCNRPSESSLIACESGVHIGIPVEKHRPNGENQGSFTSILVPALQVCRRNCLLSRILLVISPCYRLSLLK
jgi:hypothetical protein